MVHGLDEVCHEFPLAAPAEYAGQGLAAQFCPDWSQKFCFLRFYVGLLFLLLALFQVPLP